MFYTVFFNKEENKLLVDYAKAHEKGIAGVIEDAVLEKIKNELDPVELEKANEALNKAYSKVINKKRPGYYVVDVVANDDYTLLITFNSGEKKLYDAKPLLEYAIFEPLKNLAFFKKAHCDGCTVVWDDEVDVAPEHLYTRSVLIDEN